MIRKSGKDDLFQVRMVMSVDFEESSNDFCQDIYEYLIAHSANFRDWNEASGRAGFAPGELDNTQLSAFNTLLNRLSDVETVVTDRFWSTGMLAAVCSAITPSFDVTALLSKEVRDYKSDAYLIAVGALEATYDSTKRTLSVQHHARLEDYFQIQKDGIRMQAIASALHGFEWTVQALERLDIEVKDSDAEVVYCFFENL